MRRTANITKVAPCCYRSCEDDVAGILRYLPSSLARVHSDSFHCYYDLSYLWGRLLIGNQIFVKYLVAIFPLQHGCPSGPRLNDILALAGELGRGVVFRYVGSQSHVHDLL